MPLNSGRSATILSGKLIEDRDVAFAARTVSRIEVFPWQSGVGFGTRYALAVDSIATNGLSFDNAGLNITTGGGSNGPVTFPWVSGTGFGTRYANPATLTNQIRRLRFSPNDDFIAVPHNTSSLFAYPFASGYGARVLAVAGNQQYEVDWHPSQEAIAIAREASPVLRAVRFTTTFSTFYANPVAAFTTRAFSVSFNNDGSVIAVAGQDSPHIACYPFSTSTGFGTRYANPAVLPTFIARQTDFNAVTGDLTVAHDASPFISTYPFSTSTGFGTRYANPATLPVGIGEVVGFSKSGKDVFISHRTTPFVSAYPWSSGYGTRYASFTPSPTNYYEDISFS